MYCSPGNKWILHPSGTGRLYVEDQLWNPTLKLRIGETCVYFSNTFTVMTHFQYIQTDLKIVKTFGTFFVILLMFKSNCNFKTGSPAKIHGDKSSSLEWLCASKHVRACMHALVNWAPKKKKKLLLTIIFIDGLNLTFSKLLKAWFQLLMLRYLLHIMLFSNKELFGQIHNRCFLNNYYDFLISPDIHICLSVTQRSAGGTQRSGRYMDQTPVLNFADTAPW